MEAGETVITLQDRSIHHVEAQNAHGTDSYPSRKLQYGADQLTVDYGDTGEVEKITGEGNARLVSDSEGSQVTATGDRVDLEFADYNGESTLTKALVSGNGFLESKPLATPGHDPAETRILRSQIIQMKMRPGGREIDNLETQAPSELEFLPNHAGQHHRKFIGERMWIAYGAQNRIQTFTAVNCRTETDPTPEELAKKHPVTTTVSKNVSATFDPKTNQLTRMEQWDDFSYESGDRKARADRGILEQVENRITLEKHARMWDSTGNTIADHIVLDEKSGNFTAEGHVNTSRLPDQTKKKSDSAMLSGDEPLQAVARKMSSANHNKLVKYDGDAVLWQGVNRIQADHVEIDRDKRSIVADGHVITQSREEKKADADEPAPTPGRPSRPMREGFAGEAAPIFTLVKAPHMVYTDEDRLAHYSGGVLLNRAGLQMKAADLRSWLAEEGADNRLQKAFADGAVQIVQTGPIRTRTGTSEHAEYYTDEDKIVLRGGDPTMNDNVRGNTRGTELTYYSDDDRLLVKGSDGKPAISHIRKKHSAMSKLETREISKSYRGRKVVDDVTVSVDQGEVVGLLGANGAGKTTSFYMIVGLISPDSGRILVDGEDITALPMYQRARRGISYLPQEACVFRKLTVEENLMAILETLPMRNRERRENMDRLIEQLGLEKVRRSQGYMLSGGERRRVEIARSLVISPSFCCWTSRSRASIRFRCWSCSASFSI